MTTKREVSLIRVMNDLQRALDRMRAKYAQTHDVEIMDAEAARVEHAAETVARAANINWQREADARTTRSIRGRR